MQRGGVANGHYIYIYFFSLFIFLFPLRHTRSINLLNFFPFYQASSHLKASEAVGANIFVGNLDPEVDEKLLYDTFSAFGVILQPPKIMRDVSTGNSKVHQESICDNNIRNVGQVNRKCPILILLFLLLPPHLVLTRALSLSLSYSRALLL